MSYYYIEKAEAKHVSTGLPLNFSKNSQKDSEEKIAFRLHNHDIFEISTVLSDTLSFSLDGKSYDAGVGDVVISNPFVLHEGIWRGTSCEYVTLTCNLSSLFGFCGEQMRSIVSKLLSSELAFKPIIRHTEPRANEIYKHMKYGYEALKQGSPFGKCEALSHTYAIFSILTEKYLKKNSPDEIKKNNKDFFRSTTVYLEENYKKKIHTADIAAYMYMDEAQFCRKFKSHYNTNFSAYLRKYRIQKTVDIHKTFGKSMSEIATDVGFSSYRYFAKAFKEHYGVSPKRFLKLKEDS